MKRRDLINATLALPVIALSGSMSARAGLREETADTLQIRGSMSTLEIAPVLLAARDHFRGATNIRNGGIGNLVGAAPVAALGDEGRADVATHAETQALRYSVANPEVRIIMTVTEGQYRIIARRSADIERLADLKGKRIATLAITSAGFFLSQMLARVGLSFADVTTVRVHDRDMPQALARREVDAVAIWEPHGGNAALALGEDCVAFSGTGVYREMFNLNTTATILSDPAKRQAIVALVRAIREASAAIARDPVPAQALVARTAGYTLEETVRAWPTLAFPACLPDDVIDTLDAEERWLALQDGRPARSREALNRLIDPSVLADAMRT